MSAEFVSHDELETLSDRLVGYVDTAVQKYVRESERRIRSELQTFRERHDVWTGAFTALGTPHDRT